MMKTLKYILVFGLPALVCGAGWTIGLIASIAICLSSPSSSWELFLFFDACLLAALASGLLWHKHWIADEGKKPLLHTGLPTALCMVFSLSLCLAIRLAIAQGDSPEVIAKTFIGSFALFAVFSLVSLPLTLPLACLHILLHRHLARRFGPMAEKTRVNP